MQYLAIALTFTIAGASLALSADPKPADPKPVVVSDEALRLHKEALLVDGHNDLPMTLRETFGSVLRRECYEVEDAGDGEAALNAAIRGPVDLVLLDLDLRKLSGLDVLRRLRSVSTVPVIALCARETEVDRVLALELGADDCVPIPCSLAELVSRVRALLRRCE